MIEEGGISPIRYIVSVLEVVPRVRGEIGPRHMNDYISASVFLDQTSNRK